MHCFFSIFNRKAKTYLRENFLERVSCTDRKSAMFSRPTWLVGASLPMLVIFGRGKVAKKLSETLRSYSVTVFREGSSNVEVLLGIHQGGKDRTRGTVHVRCSGDQAKDSGWRCMIE